MSDMSEQAATVVGEQAASVVGGAHKVGARAPRPVIETAARGGTGAVPSTAAGKRAHARKSARERRAERAAKKAEARAAAEGAAGAKAASADAASRRPAPGGFQDVTMGFIEGVGRTAWAYADAHPHAVLYGAIGLILAVLILVVGLWHTLVIAIFTGVGVTLGQMRDGDGALAAFFSRLFGGK